MSKVKPSICALLGVCACASSGEGALTNLWRLNEGTGTTAVNAVGGTNGTVNNQAAGGQGVAGNAWVTNDPFRGTVFSGNGNDASGAFVSAGTLTAAQMNSNFTWSFWGALGAGSGGNDVILGNRFGGPGWAKFTPTNVEWQPNTGGNGNVNIADIPSDDGWHHYAIVKNGTNFQYYVDGVAGATAAFTGTFSGPVPFFMGGDSGGERAGIRMSEVAIFDQALTQSQVQTVRAGDFTAFGVGAAPTVFPGVATAQQSSGVFAVAANDLLNGLVPTVSGAAITAREGTSGNAAVLTNGLFGAANKDGAPGEVVTIDDNTILTYQLNLLAAPGGYSITGINTFSGWNDTGRDEQDFTVQVAYVGALSTFVGIGDVVFNLAGGNPSNIFSQLTNPLGGPMATNVGAIRFVFGSAENGYIGYREIDVLGIPTIPEPATATLGLLALGGLMLRRRRMA